MGKMRWEGGGTRASKVGRRGEEEDTMGLGRRGCHFCISGQQLCGAWIHMRHRNGSPVIGAGAHPYFCAASFSMRHRKGGVGCNPAVGGGAHKFSVVHGHWCATESPNSVVHALNMRHRKGKIYVAHGHFGAPQNSFPPIASFLVVLPVHFPVVPALRVFAASRW